MDPNHNHSSPQSQTLVSPTDLQNPTTNPQQTLPSAPPIQNSLPHPTNGHTDKQHSGAEDETATRRRRKSRWDPPPTEDAGTVSDGSGTTATGARKRKSRWADDAPNPMLQLPDFMKDLTAGIVLDPKIQALNNRLLEISRKFQSGLPLDDRPEGARSPSPEPEAVDAAASSSSGTDSTAGAAASTTHGGLGSNVLKPSKEFDETNLYIGYLPPTLDDDTLIRLFAPFGEIVMAKVIKDHITGLSKGYGFVKYSDVNQANTAIASMNGHLLEGRSIAVRVAGKRPPPVLPPGPPAPVPGSYPTHPAPGLPGATPAPYTGNPVPWGPPPPPPPTYASYPPPPPPPGSTVYPQVMSQPLPQYGMQYPVPAPTVSSAATSLTVPSGEMQQSVQPAYSTPTYAYAPYYGAPTTAGYTSMPQSTIDHSQIIGNVPWAPRPDVPPSAVTAETNKSSADQEYEKFLSETK
ncbi:putative RNA recognition motif domain, nucleotide-binding alpha-beta plait domain superfamily [Helianthus debilis subsp. tardiflorus]